MGPYPKRTAQHSQAGLPPSSAEGFLSWGDLTAACDRDVEPAALGSLLWLVGLFCGPPAGDPMHTVMSTACIFLTFPRDFTLCWCYDSYPDEGGFT